MEPNTTPEDYHIFDDAKAIEFYANPTRVPHVDMMPSTSDWGELSRASSEGRREPMESVTAHLRYPEGPDYMDERGRIAGRPDIVLKFMYGGGAAASLLEECESEANWLKEPRIYLWRFRVRDASSRIVECCFRALLFGISHYPSTGKIDGTLAAVDAQPLIAPVESALLHATQ